MADNKDKKPREGVTYLPIGLCLGLSLGLLFGSLMGNVGVGLCFGVSVGLCFGTAMDAARQNKPSREDSERPEGEEKPE